MSRRFHPAALLLPLSLMLGGCDMLGGESPEAVAAHKEAEGKAVGGACRHAGRAIEDCFAMNKRADKSAVFAGWREMNDYMRENKHEPVAPQGAALAEASDKAGKTPTKAEEPEVGASAAKKTARAKKRDG